MELLPARRQPRPLLIEGLLRGLGQLLELGAFPKQALRLFLPLLERLLRLVNLRFLRGQPFLHVGILVGRQIHAILGPRRLEHCLQALDLVGEFLDEVPLAHPLVDLRAVLDVLRPRRVLQRAAALVDAAMRRRERGDDARLCTAPETLLQQPRQLRVPVGHVAVMLHQRGDDAAQREKRLVDVLRLPGAVVRGTTAPDAFATGQVDQVELPVPHELLASVGHLLDHDLERQNAVAAAAVLVAERRSGRPVIDSSPQVAKRLLRAEDADLLEVLAHDAPLRVVTQAEAFAVGRVFRQQIAELLVVELQEAHAHGIVRLAAVQRFKDVANGAWNDAGVLPIIQHALHRVGLARARLPVREDEGGRPRKTPENRRDAVFLFWRLGARPKAEYLYDGQRHLLKDRLLRAVGAEDAVEVPRFHHALRASAALELHLALLRIHRDDAPLAAPLLFVAQRPTAHRDAHVYACGRRHARLSKLLQGWHSKPRG
eukprot:scaffold4236_cov200-Pinguiococcus_pyrenoidosus.AAC.1